MPLMSCLSNIKMAWENIALCVHYLWCIVNCIFLYYEYGFFIWGGGGGGGGVQASIYCHKYFDII